MQTYRQPEPGWNPTADGVPSRRAAARSAACRSSPLIHDEDDDAARPVYDARVVTFRTGLAAG